MSLFTKKKKKRQQEDLLGAPFDCVCRELGAAFLGCERLEKSREENKNSNVSSQARGKNRSAKKNKKECLTPIQSNTNGS